MDSACDTLLSWDDGSSFNFSALSPLVPTISQADHYQVSKNDFTVVSSAATSLACTKPCTPTTCYQLAAHKYRRIPAEVAKDLCAALNQTRPILKDVDAMREFVRWIKINGEGMILSYLLCIVLCPPGVHYFSGFWE